LTNRYRYYLAGCSDRERT